tara:strand:- start:100 stop:549 length:450 start_codon:yes stop_codon:yes gene_type:complete
MLKVILLSLFFFVFNSSLFSKENNYFLMLKNNKVNVRYGPSLNSPIKFIYKKAFLPVKVIDKKENFRRIIDYKKNSGWIHISQLKKSSSLIVIDDKIVFKKDTKFSKPIVKLQKGRLVLLKKCNKKWCKITTDKYSGWIEKNNLWGLNN